jgi:O-methyltransferase
MKTRIVKYIKLISPPILISLINSKTKDPLLRLYRKYKDFTMLSESTFIDNIKLCKDFEHINGCFVECGVWRGGMSAAIAEALGNERAYYLYDSFEGLPVAKEIDGQDAINWQKDKTSPIYFNNCITEIDYAEEAMTLSKATNYKIIKGWFSDTLPQFNYTSGIAILRLDGDWYDSTIVCLNKLFDKVAKGGIIIIDDYYAWDGCARAIHDFFSKNNRTERIRQSVNGVCYVIKV